MLSVNCLYQGMRFSATKSLAALQAYQFESSIPTVAPSRPLRLARGADEGVRPTQAFHVCTRRQAFFVLFVFGAGLCGVKRMSGCLLVARMGQDVPGVGEEDAGG
jgi:hypothetical protein